MPPWPISSRISSCGNCSANSAGSGGTKPAGGVALVGILSWPVLTPLEPPSFARHSRQSPCGVSAGRAPPHSPQHRSSAMTTSPSLYRLLEPDDASRLTIRLHTVVAFCQRVLRGRKTRGGRLKRGLEMAFPRAWKHDRAFIKDVRINLLTIQTRNGNVQVAELLNIFLKGVRK